MLPGGIPEWVGDLVMPVALGLIALRFAFSMPTWAKRAGVLLSVAGAFGIGRYLTDQSTSLAWPLSILVLAAPCSARRCSPRWAASRWSSSSRTATPVAAVPAEIYRLIASPTLPAIPLLTACGYVLAESGASRRLVRFFRALFGWMPGGVAVMVAAVCALFTTFTGGSGVTIIALGGLVYPMLREEGYSEGFSLGLVTAAGSLGTALPALAPGGALQRRRLESRDERAGRPALHRRVRARHAARRAGRAPTASGSARRSGARRKPFAWGELRTSLWAAKWELLLPIFVVGLFLTGLTSLVETAAAALLYAIVVEIVFCSGL